MTYRDDMRHAMAGDAHTKAHPRPKRYADLVGIGVRSAQRHRSADYTKGSPMDRAIEATYAADDPWIMVAHLRIAAERSTLKSISTPDLITRYRALLVEDKLQEARDTANALDPSVAWEDRAKDSAQDVAHDVEKGAIEQEFMVRRVPLSEVFPAA